MFYKHQTINVQNVHFAELYLELHEEHTGNEQCMLDELLQEPILLCLKTIPQAISLKEYLAGISDLPDALQYCYQSGIMIVTGAETDE